MKHVQRVTTGLLITGMMFLSIAYSQVQIRVTPEHQHRRHVEYHHRDQRRERVRVTLPVRHHVVRPVEGRHDPDRHENR